MLTIVPSTLAFFVSSYFLKRYLEELGIPRGMTRGAPIFSIALLVSYLAALAADHLPR